MPGEEQVTVLMPVYNAARFLRESIGSILAQTHGNIEFLIVNDGSTDGTRAIVESYSDPRIRLVDNERNMGMAASLNRGLALASNELVARQDGDDISAPRRIEKQAAYLSANPDVAIVGSLDRVLDENGNEMSPGIFTKPIDPVSVRWHMMFDNPFIHTSVMFRRSVIYGEYGGYRWSDICADYDLWTRVALARKTCNLPERLIWYRTHSSSIIGSLSGPDGRKRETSERERKEIISRCVRELMGEGFADSDISLAGALTRGLREDEAAPFAALLKRMLEVYTKKYPEALKSAYFRRTVASQYALAGYFQLTRDRLSALGLLGRSVRFSPEYFFSLPLAKIAALLLFGEGARSFYGRARRAARRDDKSSG